MNTDAKMTASKLIRPTLKQKKDDLPDLKVTLQLTDEVNEEDVVLIETIRSLLPLITPIYLPLPAYLRFSRSPKS